MNEVNTDTHQLITESPHKNHCFIVMPFGSTAKEQRWFKGWYKR
jgi:hypothetical protein